MCTEYGNYNFAINLVSKGLTQHFDVHPNQIAEWKNRLQEKTAGVFGEEKSKSEASKIDITRRQAKICELTLANDF